MNNKGFSLIELLVVVVIMGILAAAGIIWYNGYLAKARDIAHKANHDNIIEFVELKKLDCRFENRITFQYENNNNVFYDCASTDRFDFAQKLVVHVNNHICQYDVYQNTSIGGVHSACMMITGGYIEQATAVDVSPGGVNECNGNFIRIRAFTDMEINGTQESEYVYRPVNFCLISWIN